MVIFNISILRTNRLVSGSGDDTINGGNGDDKIKAGKGEDILAGCTGVDKFNCGKRIDTLTDFNSSKVDKKTRKCK